MSTSDREGAKHPPTAFQIQIDREHFTVSEKVMTGAELRNLPKPPIPATRDLFEIVPAGSDLKIGDSDQVQIRNGLRFFTAPGHINPGCK